MKPITNITLWFVSILLVSSCSSTPKPIDYGNDGCHYCKMTIVDKIHGAQLLTDTGKNFKFDATECMLNYIADNGTLQIGSLHTNYYEVPTAFIAIQNALFLVSENLPSPMGANVTAFENSISAEIVQAEKGGQLYTWERLKAHLNK